MRRGGQLPWNSRSGSIYGGGRRGGGAGRATAIGLILVGVAAVAFFLFSRACGGAGCSELYCSSGASIAIPEGYQRVTDDFAYRGKPVAPGQEAHVQLPLSKTLTEAQNLSFYSYDTQSKSWSPIAAALLDPQGKVVRGTLASAPAMISVFRRLLPAGEVVAYVQHDVPVHPDAIGRITILHTRDFKPASDGTIAGTPTTQRNDQAPGEKTTVAWYPVISADASDKSAVPIVTSILSSSATRSAHVQQIVKKVVESQLAGIDIAYLDLRETERTSFTLFINELAQQLHAQNKKLTLTLPTPLKAQDRVDEGAYDWGELGKSADLLEMMPYRDQGTYRLVMPDILQHLVGLVQPSKLVLMVTPYASQKAPDAVSSMPLTTAMSIATRLGTRASGADTKLTTSSVVNIVGTNIDKTDNLSGLTWSPDAACVAFTYRANGNYTVWIENFFSVGFKLEFISRYKLGGVAVEDASSDIHIGNIWPALIPFITSGQPVLLQPNPKDLVPQWKVVGADGTSKGTLEGGQRGVVQWTTPAEPGTYNVSLTISDGVALFENDIPVTVQAKPAPAATGTAAPGSTTGAR